MSGSSYSSTSTVRPSVRKINNSLYELYAPPAGERPIVEIIFFHGLHLGVPEDAFWKTWTTCENECWPQTWLAQELPQARILSVAYDASVNQSDKWGLLELYNIGENLVVDIICSTFADVAIASCPVFLVAHSLGGLVAKQMILHADREVHRADPNPRLKIFLDNLRGIVYFSTPHAGADIRNFTSHFSYKSPVTSALRKLSAQGARLNEDFRKWRGQHRVKAYAVAESEETRVNGYSGLVVTEASARHDVDIFHKSKGDHFTVCAPESPGTDSGIQLLASFIRTAAYPAQDGVRAENFQHLPKYVVGIDRAVEEIKAKLVKSTSLGLVGMGGIEKTVLAKAVFNILGPQYEYSCFIDEKNIQGGVEAVKKAVLQHVHHRGKKIEFVDGGLNLLQGKRLFLVLDDATSEHRDLEILSILEDDIGVDKGSRFIVTSKDVEVVTGLDDSYEVPLLDRDSSTILLTGLAFGDQQSATPAASLQEYVDIVVTKCDGLPLALEVLGKYLRKKGENIWKQAVRALHEADNVVGLEERLWAQLRVSFDGLQKKDQEMFLDAATVFYGRHLLEAKQIWSILMDYEDLRWKRLVDLSLVREGREPDTYNDERHTFVTMHGQLLSMGRKIALTSGENGKCSRVWDSKKAAQLLSTAENSSCNDDIEDIVALELGRAYPSLQEEELPDCMTFFNNLFDISATDAQRSQTTLRELRARPKLEMVDTYISIIGSIMGMSPKEMHAHATSLRNNNVIYILGNVLGKMPKLQYLYLADVDIKQVDGAPVQLPSKLMCLQCVNAKFDQLPFDLNSRNLAYLSISICDQLQTLPPNFCLLSVLQHLKIEGAKSLVSLSDTFGHLPMLRKLEIRRCPKLLKLPPTLGKLVTLETLNLEDCDTLTIPPDEIGYLLRVKELAIDGCHLAQVSPNALRQLVGLKHLALRNLTSGSILESMDCLVSLKTLKLRWMGVALSFPTLLPRWLEGVITPRNFRRPKGWTFTIRDGKFNLEEGKKDREERPLFDMRQCLDLRQRAVLKRLNGDLVGAHEDLTEALEKPPEEGGGDYFSRKHRGYVRFLMGDLEGARADGEKALELKHALQALLASGCLEGAPAIKTGVQLQLGDWDELRATGKRSPESFFLGITPLEYLGFKL